ncbi:MAG: D-alanine--D-alanine ligase [Lewinellaceae bacterium]|nr:D-alanine--D-alanine ligase [Lewinellaceae bacterium]
MGKLTVAIITGGDVAERGISLQSAKTIQQHLAPEKYETYVIDFSQGVFREQQSGTAVDLNGFRLHLGDREIRFDLAYLILHGHPAEDGNLQGYFRMMGIPFTGCDIFASALTFDKQATKNYLAKFDIPMAPSALLHKGHPYDLVDLLKMGLPLFVKPNKNGSSYGVTKVKTAADLEPAIALAFDFDNEVVVEGFLNGSEYSNGVFRDGENIVVLPITEIVPHNEFFDYAAKYENKSDEITPARLSEELTLKCQAQTKKIYEAIGCQGVVRVDSIKVGDTFYFLEVNTIPGMSEASIVPQQTRNFGWTVGQLLDRVIAEALARN